MKIGLLGSGEVAKTLGSGFLKHGYEVMLGSRTPAKLDEWVAANPSGKAGTFDDAAAFGDLLVLSVLGHVASDALRSVDARSIAGKTILDTTNPIAEAPPKDGILTFSSEINHSLMERLQAEFKDAHFVKAFNSVGSASMVNPEYKEGRPTMFICGNDAAAKKLAASILDQFGWDTEDMGVAEAARAIEPLCMLWCIPGFLRNEWTHAFKLVKR